MKLKNIFSILLVLSTFSSYSQEILENKIFRDNIYTALIYKDGTEFSYPVINLNSEEKLILSFDEIGENLDYKDFQYTIIHCDAEWKQSDLMFMEYIDGFEENDIDEINNSFSTTCKYVNYQVTFPNDYIDFKISGNYIIKVYEDYDTEDVVLIKRFCVTEQLINIDGTVKKSTNPGLMDNYQEVDFSLNYSGYNIINPIKDIQVIIKQNNRPDNQIANLKPKFIKTNELDYNYDFENNFQAANEFRYFDSKNLKFSTDKVLKVDYIDNFYNIFLKDDKIRSTEPYLFYKDLNGLFFIRNEHGYDSSVESDYCYVHFIFKRNFPFIDEMYVIGEFNNWECSDEYQMIYNQELQQYEATTFLKQGYYNYLYTLKSSKNSTTTVPEGNFSDTENDYLIYVYHYDASFQYDRLIAVKILNSGQ